MAAVLAAAMSLALLASGCDDDLFGGGNKSGGGSNGDQPKVASTKKADTGCRQPGPLTSAMLPSFSEPDFRSVANPCVPFVGLLDQVGQLVPEGGEKQVAKFPKFVEKVKGFVGTVSTLNDTAKCGYETDRLAIVLYQDQRNDGRNWYSIGIVAVVRGRLGAVADVAVCLIKEELGIGDGDKFFAIGPPVIDPCFGSARRSREGQDYTVMWLGSTDQMCAGLTGQLDPQSSVRGTILAKPNLLVRDKPSTKGVIAGRAPNGMSGVVLCRADGEQVANGQRTSAIWLKMTINGFTGYVASVYVDTGGDATKQTKPCT